MPDVLQQSAHVTALISDALLVYGADKTGKVDYALESGGRILHFDINRLYIYCGVLSAMGLLNLSLFHL